MVNRLLVLPVTVVARRDGTEPRLMHRVAIHAVAAIRAAWIGLFTSHFHGARDRGMGTSRVIASPPRQSQKHHGYETVGKVKGRMRVAGIGHLIYGWHGVANRVHHFDPRRYLARAVEHGALPANPVSARGAALKWT